MKKLKYSLFSLFVLFALFCVYFLTYTFVEPKAYDFMTKNMLTEKLPFDVNKNVYGHNDIILVVIDSKTNEKYRWPWKRELNCKIFEYFLKYAHPKVLVHDSVISTLDLEYPESDKKLFSTLNKFNNLAEGFIPLVQDWENKDLGEAYDKAFIKKYSVNVENKGNSTTYLYSSLMPFPQPYFDAVKNVGSVTLIPSFIDGKLSSFTKDNINRNYEYFINYKNNFIPSLAMKTYMLANNVSDIIIKNNQIILPERNIPQKTTIYQMITPIRYYKMYGYESPFNGYSHQKYSAVDIMDSYDNLESGKKPIIDAEIFNDKIVVIGANVSAGTGLNDIASTPMSAYHPGVDIQATAVDNIMHGDFIKIVPNFLNILFALLGMLFVYFTIMSHHLYKAVIYSITIMVLYLAMAAACFYYGVVINVITPPVVFAVTMILAYIHRYLIEERNKEKVKSAMGKYMSEDVMEKVIENIDNLGLGGKKANVTVLFSDIRNFTSMSEKMSAAQVSEILNEYFSEMEPIIAKYNGIINKFIGDAIMAVFGEPINDEKHPSNAVKCGIEMLNRVQEMHEKWSKENKPLIEIGIGINTGEVFVGNIGSAKRMEYTVIGDTVNLASRLESYNKIYKTKILISPSTYEASKDLIEVNKISDVEIRGKAEKIDIYEVLKLV